MTHDKTVPDFRSPGTGLYANLARLNLPYAEAVFDISYFREKPEPFYILARELYPGNFHPTISHAFIALLARKGLLDKLFTQNIDCLERRAGVPADLIVEAHGSFATQRCIDCKLEFPDDKMKDHVFKGKVPKCEVKNCGGLVKPDIVFFGEGLPREFSEQSFKMAMADLVLVIGTSLSVYPFASLPDMTSTGKPRVLFNLERVGTIGSREDDVLHLEDSDAGIRTLAKELGWADELDELWRGVVGHKEAERQNAGRKQKEEVIEDEVEKLTENVASTLNLEESVEKKDNQQKEMIVEDESENTKQPTAGNEQPKEDTKASAEPPIEKTTRETSHDAKQEGPIAEQKEKDKTESKEHNVENSVTGKPSDSEKSVL